MPRPSMGKLCLALLLLSLGGCMAIGAIAYKVSGPGKVPAKHTLKDQPTAVVVERAGNPSASELESDEICRSVWVQLNHYKLAKLIDPADVLDLRAKRADFHRMGVSEIGMAVGANQAVYVDLVAFHVEMQASGYARGTAVARVKVIDCVSRETRFPTELADGYPVRAQVDWQRPSGVAPSDAVRRALVEALSVEVANLFRERTAEGEEAERR